MSLDSGRGAGYAVCDAAGERAGAANFVSRGHWDEAVSVGPDTAASALRGLAGACERDRLRRYATVRCGGGGAAAGGGGPSCARGLCGADCHWTALRSCGWGECDGAAGSACAAGTECGGEPADGVSGSGGGETVISGQW